MESLFTFVDYREYIRTYYDFKKKNTRNFSYRSFTAEAGFTSPVFIKLVIESKSNLSLESATKLGKAMGLDENEIHYFTMLVEFNQARTDDSKRNIFMKLSEFMKKLKVKVVDEDNYTYYDNWYYSVIRELITFPAFQGDYSKLGDVLHPALGKREVNKALKVLEENGFIFKDEKGVYRQTDKHITTGTEISSLAVRNYHKHMGKRAVEAVDTVTKEERDFSGLTLGISAERLPILKEELAAFRRRIIQLASEDKQAEMVYRLNLQLFPLTEKIPSKKNDDGEEN